MSRPARRVLLEGRPGIGKTTVARRLLGLLRDSGVAVAGFTTEEIREGGSRVGFAIETASGERGTLAHVSLAGPPRVGRYGVDLAAFERLALPALAVPAAVTVVDELGKMELASDAFRTAIESLFGEERRVVATVHAYRHAFTDRLKARRDVELIKVTRDNRDALPDHLARRLALR